MTLESQKVYRLKMAKGSLGNIAWNYCLILPAGKNPNLDIYETYGYEDYNTKEKKIGRVGDRQIRPSRSTLEAFENFVHAI